MAYPAEIKPTIFSIKDWPFAHVHLYIYLSAAEQMLILELCIVQKPSKRSKKLYLLPLTSIL